MIPPREMNVVVVALLSVAASRATAQTPPAPSPPATAAAPAASAAPAAPNTPPADPNATAAALQQAKDAFKKGAWQEARDAAVIVLAAQPKQLEALYIAGTSERQSSQLADAEQHLKALVEASPIFPLGHFQYGYVLFLQAEELSRQGQAEPGKAKYVDAAAEFGKEIERNPTHAASLSSRAIALSRGGRVDESVQAHEAWIAAAPQKNDPVVSLAATFANAGRSSDAMAALDRLPDRSPKAVFDATLAAAGVFMAKKDWGASVPFLEKAADTDPASTRARGLLVASCARAGLINDAVRHLQTFLTMDPTPDEAESVGEAIKATLGDGKSAPSAPGVEPPGVLRVPTPRYPKGQDMSTQTEVLLLALIREDGVVVNTVVVPNRIWKDIHAGGFDVAAADAVKRGKFAPGTKNGQPAPLWVVVPVRFQKS